MKTLLLATILAFGGSFVPSAKQSNVYICVSPNAKKYHLMKNCRGLNACTHQIKAVTLDEAKNKYRMTICGWED